MLNENIKALRKAKGLSQEELAIKLNVIRLLPPLCLTMAEADEFLERFRKVLV